VESNRKRTAIWIDPRLILMLNDEGWELSTFVRRAAQEYLELPEDPRDKIKEEKLKKMVLRIRSTITQEIQEAIKADETENVIKKTQEDIIKEKESNLIHLGEWIQKRSEYPEFQRYFIRHDYDDDILHKVHFAYELECPGRFSHKESFWNALISWYNKYGRVVS